MNSRKASVGRKNLCSGAPQTALDSSQTSVGPPGRLGAGARALISACSTPAPSWGEVTWLFAHLRGFRSVVGSFP